MAMRNRYAVRVSLDESRLNTPVDLFSADSAIQIKREVTARTFLLVAVAIVGLIWIFTHTFVEFGGFLGIVVFLIGYIWMTSLIAGVTPDNREGYQLMPSMYEYLFKENRDISTRPLSKDIPAIKHVSNIAGYDKNHDYILFNNGDIGQIFELSGNASLLSFDSDLSNTIDSAERFFNSIGNHVSLIYDTVTGPQRVVDQVDGKSLQIDELSDIFDYDIHHREDNGGYRGNAYTAANNNIRNLMYAQRDVLENYIGKEFQSLRQYVMIRAINVDSLYHARDWLMTQQSDSGDTYIKSARMLSYDETVDYLKNIFSSADMERDTNSHSSKGNEG